MAALPVVENDKRRRGFVGHCHGLRAGDAKNVRQVYRLRNTGAGRGSANRNAAGASQWVTTKAGGSLTGRGFPRKPSHPRPHTFRDPVTLRRQEVSTGNRRELPGSPNGLWASPPADTPVSQACQWCTNGWYRVRTQGPYHCFSWALSRQKPGCTWPGAEKQPGGPAARGRPCGPQPANSARLRSPRRGKRAGAVTGCFR